MSKTEIELEDIETGERVTVSVAYYIRWRSSIEARFRPVSEKKATPAVASPQAELPPVESN